MDKIKLIQDGEDIVEFNVDNLESSEFVDKVKKLMEVQGYHPVSIWRAFKNKADDMEELFDSIMETKEEWK